MIARLRAVLFGRLTAPEPHPCCCCHCEVLEPAEQAGGLDELLSDDGRDL